MCMFKWSLICFFSDLIVKVIQQNMGGIKIEEWRKVIFFNSDNWEELDLDTAMLW